MSADEKLGHEIVPSSYVAAFVTGDRRARGCDP